MFKQINQQPFHVRLRNLTRKIKLASDRGGSLWIENIKARGNAVMRQNVLIALWANRVCICNGIARSCPAGLD